MDLLPPHRAPSLFSFYCLSLFYFLLCPRRHLASSVAGDETSCLQRSKGRDGGGAGMNKPARGPGTEREKTRRETSNGEQASRWVGWAVGPPPPTSPPAQRPWHPVSNNPPFCITSFPPPHIPPTCSEPRRGEWRSAPPRTQSRRPCGPPPGPRCQDPAGSERAR